MAIPDPTFTPATTPGLDAARVLRLAAQSLFDTFGRTAMGTMVVDREHRIVWIDDGYRRFLPALGHAEDDFIGRRVEEVVPNTLMGQVIDSGQAILVDLLSNQAGTFLVTRLPLRNDAGVVIGAVGFVLLDHPETTMLPLMQKFSRLQQELDSTRHQLAQQIAQQQAAQRRPKHSIASFIGTSPAALEVKRQARRVAQIDSTVLLLGETGTGKELLAHGVHGAGRRAAKPFVGVNIAAVPDTLLEAEFFGVAPGAFTGAERKGRDGKFKVADGGTLFLDEIGDMPFDLQTRLLRVLSDGHFYRVGGHQPLKSNVRVIAATHQNLEERVRQGAFREDLYHRLNVIRLRLPPLRERREDIPMLTRLFLGKSARELGVDAKRITDQALAQLAGFDFSGNVRQLENICHWLTVMAPSQVIEAKDLPPEVLAGQTIAAVAYAATGAQAAVATVAVAQPAFQAHNLPPVIEPSTALDPVVSQVPPTLTNAWETGLEQEAQALLAAGRTDVWDELTRRVESSLIRTALVATRGRRIEAAQKLGIGRNTITRKIQELGLK